MYLSGYMSVMSLPLGPLQNAPNIDARHAVGEQHVNALHRQLGKAESTGDDIACAGRGT